jgi:hypothetical protein
MAKVADERKRAKESDKRVREVELEKIPEDIEHLKAADVWILNEVDWGVKRTEYREVVRELAETLNMNWAYGVEFWKSIPNSWGPTPLITARTSHLTRSCAKSSR